MRTYFSHYGAGPGHSQGPVYIFFGLAHNLWLLFLSRLIAGIMGGNISTAQAYVADVTSHEERARGMGLIGAAFGIGFVMGPAISAVLIHPSFLKTFHVAVENEYAIPGFFAAGLSFISFLLVFFKLPETVQRTKKDSGEIIKNSLFTKRFWQILLEQNRSGARHFFPMLIGCAFLYSFAQSSLYSSFPLFCEAKLDLSATKVGMLYAYLGIIAILVQGVGIRPLVKRFGEERLYFTGSILMMAGFASIPMARTEGLLLVFLGLLSLGGSLMGPTLNSLISKEADPKNVGRAMGASQGIAALGRVVGPTWGGLLYGISAGAPFLATAAFLVLTILAGARLVRLPPSTSPPPMRRDC